MRRLRSHEKSIKKKGKQRTTSKTEREEAGLSIKKKKSTGNQETISKRYVYLRSMATTFWEHTSYFAKTRLR